MKDTASGFISLYSEVESSSVKWLWYPYIPLGKITILQGDPGDGKSLLISKIIAEVTRGNALPGDPASLKKAKIIYQCSEDSSADTIKPRLMKAGADCHMVAFIKEADDSLTLDDERVREAILRFGAKLIVIDPVQAYLGDAEISNAKSIRKIMRRLALWADMYGCAIVLVGHLNKNEHSKDLYRSLGSIDVMATARSVLQIERAEKQNDRSIVQLKNSLAPFGQQVSFTIMPDGNISWGECLNNAIRDIETVQETIRLESKAEIAARIMNDALCDHPQKVNDIYQLCENSGISPRTMNKVKKDMGIQTYRKDKQWYWCMAEAEEGAES